MRGKNKVKFLLKVFVINGLVFFSLMVVGIFSFWAKKSEEKRTERCVGCHKFSFENKRLGRWYKRGSSSHARKYCSDESLCYDVWYEHGPAGERTTKIKAEVKKHLILLGGSYVFGEGLNNKGAISYHLAKKTKMEVLNFGLQGGGRRLLFDYWKRGSSNRGIKKGLPFIFSILFI